MFHRHDLIVLLHSRKLPTVVVQFFFALCNSPHVVPPAFHFDAYQICLSKYEWKKTIIK